MNIADELQKLQQLRQSGAISEEEYDRAKEKVISGQSNGGSPFMGNFLSGDADSQTRLWGMILHLSLLLSFSIVGIVVPILIWQLKKNELPAVDEHGKNAVNWLISACIYFLVGCILAPMLVGIPLLWILGVLQIVFPIVAAIKANGGEVWKYPAAIAFFK
jgi:uncharacterized protein